jgi:hypothetical protein
MDLTDMTTNEANRIITEKLFGRCWHEWETFESSPSEYILFVCKKCKLTVTDPDNHDIDLLTPEGFFKLWERLRGNYKLWSDFIDFACPIDRIERLAELIDNRPLFVQTVAEWIKEGGVK